MIARAQRATSDSGRQARLDAQRRHRGLLMVAAVKVLCEHHPQMRLLQLAWHHGHEDPWRLHHMLGEDLRPLDGSSDEPKRPQHPERLQAMRLAFGQVAAERLAQGQKAVGRGLREALDG